MDGMQDYKVMFVSRELTGTSGAAVGAKMHLNVLKAIVGISNIYIIDLCARTKPERRQNFIAYGKYKNKWERLKRTLEGNTFYISNEIISEVCSIIGQREIGFVFVDDSILGKLVAAIKKRFPEIPVVSFYHDVKAELYPKWMQRCKWYDKINYRIAIKEEMVNFRNTDCNIVLNRKEDVFLKKHYGGTADYYLPVCVEKMPHSQVDPYADNGKRHILFVGTSYYPNIQGIKWFCETIFCKIRENYDIWIVGKGLEILKEDFCDRDVQVIGFVEELAGYYSFADVVIAPLKDGGGMKIKTAEAISFGKTFVGSSESLEGYYEEMNEDIIGVSVFRCDTVEQYLEAFDTISTKFAGKQHLSLTELYDKKFSSEAAIRTMKEIMESIIHEP